MEPDGGRGALHLPGLPWFPEQSPRRLSSHQQAKPSIVNSQGEIVSMLTTAGVCRYVGVNAIWLGW